MPQRDFMAKVTGQIANARKAMTAVYRESAQRVIELAQTPVGQGGNMPVKTGFLRASGQAVLNGEPMGLVDRPAGAETSYSYDAGQVSLVIASAELSDRITFAYTAKYARAQEYGANGRAGRRFVGLAAQQWPQIVAQVAGEAQAKMGG